MFDILAVTAFCWALDIGHQASILDAPHTDLKQKTAAAKSLTKYHELSYYQTRNQLTPLGETWCVTEVYPVALSRRTKILITDLDGKQFAGRQRAQEELLDVGRYNKLLLWDALSKAKSLEVKQRLSKILEELPSNRSD